MSGAEEEKVPTREERFVAEYLVDGIGKRAAIRAGYSPKSAESQASRLLSKAKVRARIEKALAEQSRRTGITADRVLKELAKCAFADITDVANAASATLKDDAQRDDTAAIKSIRVKTIPSEDGDIVEREIEMMDKTKSLELLGKHFNLFQDRVKLTGDKAEPIQVIFGVPRPSDEPDDAPAEGNPEDPPDPEGPDPNADG